MLRGLLVLIALVFSATTARADAPATSPLRRNAPRGNAGKPPPQGGQWPGFNGTPSAAFLAGSRLPPHATPQPLSGLNAAAAHPSAPATSALIRDALTTRGVKPAIATRAADHVLLGMPSASDHASSDDYLVARKDVVLSYSSTRMSPNWVSWTTGSEHLGKSMRSDETWRADPSLPANFRIMTFHDYEKAGFDPGHLLPSADRTANVRANRRTYLTSNTVPQSFNVNRGPWAKLENYTRDMVRDGKLMAHVLAGPVYGAQPLTLPGNIPIPNATWKIVVFLPRGQSLADVNAQTPVVSVLMPNSDAEVGAGADYANFLTTPAEIERRTGLRFFTNLPTPIADVLRQKRDAGPPPPPRPPKPQVASTN